jgi:hypothetical protein
MHTRNRCLFWLPWARSDESNSTFIWEDDETDDKVPLLDSFSSLKETCCRLSHKERVDEVEEEDEEDDEERE